MKSIFYVIVSFLFVLFSMESLAQQKQEGKEKKVEGTVTNANHEPLPAASVLVKGSNRGVITDEDGHYAIEVQGETTLIFSMIGYSRQEVSTEGKTRVDVQLRHKGVGMDSLVVVGYSSVEREHIASSVAQMDMEKVTTRPIHKLNQAFSGTIPGVTMLQSRNMPGDANGSIQIRGISTLQNASPLVIVDGMEQSLNDIDPDQIESITVLKDAASAAMYGSRGANGVIIVETKRGEIGNFKVDINTWASVDQPINLPRFVGIADYMKLDNEARTIQGQSLNYSEEDIQKAENGELKGVNWLDEIMQKTPFTYNTTASVSGGGGVGSFNLMLGHIKESGLNDIEGTEKFSARFNTNVNIDNKFVLLADF